VRRLCFAWIALVLISSKVCDAAESSCTLDVQNLSAANADVVRFTNCLHDHCADASDQDVAFFTVGFVGNCSALYNTAAGDCNSDISSPTSVLPSGTPLHKLCGSKCSAACLVAGGGSKMPLRRPLNVSQDTNVQQHDDAAQANTEGDDGHTFATGSMMIAATVVIVLALVGLIVCFYIVRHLPVTDANSAPNKSEKVIESDVNADSRV